MQVVRRCYVRRHEHGHANPKQFPILPLDKVRSSAWHSRLCGLWMLWTSKLFPSLNTAQSFLPLCFYQAVRLFSAGSAPAFPFGDWILITLGSGLALVCFYRQVVIRPSRVSAFFFTPITKEALGRQTFLSVLINATPMSLEKSTAWHTEGAHAVFAELIGWLMRSSL